jgi:arylformamidase
LFQYYGNKDVKFVSEYTMGNLRVIDLTKRVDPATETRLCNLDRFYTGGHIPDYHTNLEINSHLGTHVECPYHHHDDWSDVGSLPLTSFLGRAIYLNFTELGPNSYITKDDLEAVSGGRIKPGDIVILDSPHKIPPFTEKTNTDEDKRLLVSAETAIWLRDQKVKCVGFGDGVSVESNNEDISAFHDILMVEDIVFLEVLKNLELLRQDVFFMSYTPLYIKGLDSSPVRAYAIEGLAEFA